MSENERKELSEKLHFGLALAERRMLEEKALRNECIIQGLPNGEIKSVPARIMLRRLYGEELKRQKYPLFNKQQPELSAQYENQRGLQKYIIPLNYNKKYIR